MTSASATMIELATLTPQSARAIRALLRTMNAFPARDVVHALEHAVITRLAAGEAASPDDLAIVSRVVARASATAHDTPAVIAAKLQRYYVAQPVRADVVAAFAHALRALAAEGHDHHRGVQSLIGAASSVVPVGAHGRVDGAIPGGPLARIATLKDRRR